MNAPRFEELAQRWAGKAEIFYVFSEEAHPHAQSAARLEAFAANVQKLDRDHDGTVTPAEYAAMGPMAPQSMFDAFDVDHDGVIRSYEFLAARRLVGEAHGRAVEIAQLERRRLLADLRRDLREVLERVQRGLLVRAAARARRDQQQQRRALHLHILAWKTFASPLATSTIARLPGDGPPVITTSLPSPPRTSADSPGLPIGGAAGSPAGGGG